MAILTPASGAAPLGAGGRGGALRRGGRATVRWLTGGYGTVEGTREHFAMLADNARRGEGRRSFGVWLDGRLAGFVEANPDNRDGLVAGQVNISYAVHPWARGRGLAVAAVRQICEVIVELGLGGQAAIRVEPANIASVRVAERACFRYVRDFRSERHSEPDGSPSTMRLYLLDLVDASMPPGVSSP